MQDETVTQGPGLRRSPKPCKDLEFYSKGSVKPLKFRLRIRNGLFVEVHSCCRAENGLGSAKDELIRDQWEGCCDDPASDGLLVRLRPGEEGGPQWVESSPCERHPRYAPWGQVGLLLSKMMCCHSCERA